MAKRKKQDPDLELDEQSAETGARSRIDSIRRTLRFVGWTSGLVVAVFTAGWINFQAEQFFSKDPRFHIAAEGDPGVESAVTIRGAKNASRAALMRVFDADRGRSLADLDPAKRRMQLRTVEWVRDASVRRVWPNRVEVDVEERTPVAFVQMASSMSGSFTEPVAYKPMLIDADGVILRMKGPVPQTLPLLAGVRESDDVERRRRRVALMLRVLQELKDHRESIAEVNVADPENVRVAYQMQEEQVTLILGNEKFAHRLGVFLEHYPGIRDKLPQHAVLDVTLDGRILAVHPMEAAAR